LAEIQLKLRRNRYSFFHFTITKRGFIRKTVCVFNSDAFKLIVLRKFFPFIICVFIVTIVNNKNVQAQSSPAITYPTSKVYTVGSTITPLLPTNTGGTVFPANYNTPALFAPYTTPFSIAIDGSNNVYTTNNTTGDLTKFSPAGQVLFTVNTGDPQASEVAIDGLGNVFVSQFTDNNVLKYNSTGTLLATVTGFSDPYEIAFDASNNAYVANYITGDILEIKAGTSTAIPYLTGFNKPYGVIIDAAGNLFVSEQGPGDIIKVAAGTSTRTTFATGFNGPRHLNKDIFGNIYVADYGNNAIKRISPAGTITTIISAGLSSPRQAGFDSSGNLFIADYGSNTILKSIPTSYSINTPLSAGLSFNTSSGQITGTPTAAAPITKYTVTAYNTGGSDTASFSITVGLLQNPADSTIAATAIAATTATLNGFANANGAATTVSYTYGTDPNLINATTTTATTNSNLNIGTSNSSTLLLTGLNPSTTYYYRITATNSYGTTTGSILSFITLQSANASLASLTTSAGTIAPIFDPTILSYNTVVSNSISSITITPVTSDPTATLTVNGVTLSNGNASAPIALNAGNNTITAVVTANNGLTTTTYTLTVTRQQPAPPTASTVATLSNLTISGVNLNPGFTAATTSYLTNVGNAIASVTVTPAVSDTTATVTVNGVTVAQGSTSANIPLNVGINTITTVVTAQDGTTTDTYTTTITRAASSTATLANLVASTGTLNPAFAPGTTNYTATVSNTAVSVNITPSATDTTATLTVNGISVLSGTASANIPLNVGANIITTVVTAQDGITTQSYTLTVTRQAATTVASSIATLSNLTISSVNLSPVFTAGTNSYTAGVSNTTTSVTVVPSPTDSTATVTVNGVVVLPGSPSASLPLNIGLNTITTIVTAQDGTTVTYTTTITRAASSNATLANLTVSNGSLAPNFAPTTNNYTVKVSRITASVSITPTVADSTAVITINGTVIASGTASANLPLNLGSNVITTVVTAQDGTTADYTLTITRQGPAPILSSANSNLANLAISSGTLSPAFSYTTTAYTANVGNSTASITVTPTAADSTATITVNGVQVASGTTSASLPLNAGANTITTVITSQDSTTTSTYTITVTRAPSNNAALSLLTTNTRTALTTTSGPASQNFATSVSFNTTSITLTPTAVDPNASITVNGLLVRSGFSSLPILLSPYTTLINLLVTAQDGVTTRTFTLKVTRTGSNNASLSFLRMSTGTLTAMPGSGMKSYTSWVPYTVSTIKLIPAAADSNATVVVNGVAVSSGSASSPIALNVGQNVITTTVTAQDGTTIATYTTVITRGPSNNASLISITANTGTLFNSLIGPGNQNYITTVNFAATNIILTPTAVDPGAHITINGSPVVSGSPSSPITLNAGPTVINLLVTAQDGVTTRTFTVTVTRTGSSNARLTYLRSSSGTLTSVSNPNGNESFSTTVPYTTSSITLTPTTSDPNSSVMISGSPVLSGSASLPATLNVGPNIINVVVTAQDGITVKTYLVTVTRQAPSTNATLASLTPSIGTIAPAFDPSTFNYYTTVDSTASTITITPVTADATETLTVNGTVVASGSPSASITLTKGVDTITTVVTAQDGTTIDTYTMVVGRQKPALSADASLASLSPANATGTGIGSVVTVDNATYPLNGTTSAGAASSSANATGIILSPNFNPAIFNYTAAVDNAISSITITAAVNNPNAILKVNGTILTSGTPSAPIALTTGDNTITMVVLAEDGVTTQTYTLDLTRQAPSNADSTRSITFNDLGLKTYGDPDFDAGAFASTSEPIIYNNFDPKIISITNGKIHIIGAGTTTITATVAADKNYSNIPAATQTLVVNKAKQTISLSPVPNQERGTSYTLTEATSSSKLPIVYKSSDSSIMSIKGSTLNAIQLGSVFLTATQPGNENYAPAANVNELVTIQDQNGDQILVHQAVSPNGDGVNDYLLIEGIENYPTNRVAIINLNGETVFDVKGYDNSTKAFDGHSNINGHVEQPGTYFYMVEYTVNGQTRRKTGYFILKIN